jgi:hypothetical protein
MARLKQSFEERPLLRTKKNGLPAGFAMERLEQASGSRAFIFSARLTER